MGKFAVGVAAGVPGAMRDNRVSQTPPLFYDTFTGADNTAITSRAPDIGTSWSAGKGTFKLSSNRCVTNTLVGDEAIAVANSTQANAKITCDISGVFGVNKQYSAVMVRYVDTSNLWFVQLDNAEFSLTEKNANTYTKRASTAIASVSSQVYTCVVIANGTTISATLDGAYPISYGSATLNSNSDKHGIRAGFSTAVATFDNFKIEAL